MAPPGTEHAGAASADEQAIHNLAAAVVEALNRADTRAYAAYFDENADYTSAVGMQVRGRDAIQALHDAAFTEPQTPDWPSFRNAVTAFHSVRTRFVRPDVAVVDIRWSQKGVLGPDGRPWENRKGVMSWVVTKENANWVVVASHNMQLPG
ncbi:MAG TPA: SgcJ/EcaC family oxidoreductase [Bryobacteraceae bacterium]|nr:SgcJ/EcaC family oxidoreductase [Bryobacteraceae bacterium]